MKRFNDLNIKSLIKDLNNGRLKKDLTDENIEVLNKILEDITNKNFENFEAFNKIIQYSLFDEKYYVNQCESKIEINPLLHYIYYGHTLGLNPCELFDTDFYRTFNPNIKNNENPLVYLVNHGIHEGIIKVNKDIWQPPAINKYEIDKKIEKFDKYGLNNNERNIPIIISLTSYPKRINEVKYTIYSLLTQEFKADKIVLWLSEEEFPKKELDLPNNLLKFLKYGLTIKWCNIKKSYKKLIPSLNEYPEAVIVTADDDLFYPENWLKLLYEHHQKYPENIVTHRSRKISFNNSALNKYTDWKVLREEQEPSFLNFFTTGAGVLFPPHSLSKLVFETKIREKICPTTDDIWFWTMAVLNDTKISVVKNCIWELTYVNPARDLLFKKDTLWSFNETHNDERIKEVLENYPEVFKKIMEDNEKKYEIK